MPDAVAERAALPTGDGELPLLKLIDRIRASQAQIQEQVDARRVRLARITGLSGRPLADRLADELIGETKARTALIGAALALPFTLPLLGFWGTLAVTVIGTALLQLAAEVELVFALAHVYGSRLEPEKLRLTAFWLVQLRHYEDLRERALSLGVRLTVRKLVEKLIAVGLARAFEATAHEVMMARMMGRAPAEPWPVRATRYLGVPVLFYFGWRNAAGVGARAKAYFQEETAGAPVPAPS